MSKGADGLTPDQIGDLMETQIAAQGTGCVQVDDGQIFVFNRATLERLLTAAIESGEDMAMIFVPRGAQA